MQGYGYGWYGYWVGCKLMALAVQDAVPTWLQVHTLHSNGQVDFF